MHKEITDQQEALKRLFARAHELQRNDNIDNELKAHFTWYLCVRTSGFVESSIKTTLQEYINSGLEQEMSCDEPNRVSRRSLHLQNQLRKTLNPKKKRILRLLSEFREEWKIDLDSKLTREMDDSLESIVNNRNSICHGNDIRLTLQDLQYHFAKAQEVVRLVFDQCKYT